MSQPARSPTFDHTPLLTLDEAAWEAGRRRAPLHAWCVVDGRDIHVFFHAECVIHLDVLGLDGVDAVAALLGQPLRLYRVEFYRWPQQRTLLAEWSSLRAAAERRKRPGSTSVDDAEATTRLGIFGAQM